MRNSDLNWLVSLPLSGALQQTPSAFGRPVKALAGLVLAFVLLAPDASAQTTVVCGVTPGSGERIECTDQD